MSMTDPIADMFTRIRNAQATGKRSVAMPASRVKQAIANLLTGRVDPSGRLAVSFPAATAQLARPDLIGWDTPTDHPKPGTPPIALPYREGGDVGYRWYKRQKLKPLFPFGFGLSYTRFSYSDLAVRGGDTLRISFTVRNIGSRAGADVPQAYLTSIGGSPEPRLIGWDKIVLAPGDARIVSLTVDPRLLAHFDLRAHAWRVAGASYGVAVGASAEDPKLEGSASVTAATIKP